MSKLTTPLCQKPGIEHPIIGAPISAEPEFVAAVSNSGGLGIIQASWYEAEELLDTILQVRRLTDRPFGANFVLPLIEDQGFANLIAALEAKVPVISTFWGDLAPVVERIRDADALSLPTVGSAEEARRVVDVVVAQGVEAGGHVWGQVGTIALTPAVVDAIPGMPIQLPRAALRMAEVLRLFWRLVPGPPGSEPDCSWQPNVRIIASIGTSSNRRSKLILFGQRFSMAHRPAASQRKLAGSFLWVLPEQMR